MTRPDARHDPSAAYVLALMTEVAMDLLLRPGTRSDAVECGRICFAAFDRIAHEHGFPGDFPSMDAATGLMDVLLAHPGFYSVVAELDGRIVGSNFLDERSPVVGVGP
ncbi:hypothetical protein [Nonomuraea sp. NPDC050691]|uniref:hypothetical protein n=1 Tax=Nonomuraea sp. NPDC050691 TaxID=3155661 RepID=UPI0033F75086